MSDPRSMPARAALSSVGMAGLGISLALVAIAGEQPYGGFAGEWFGGAAWTLVLVSSIGLEVVGVMKCRDSRSDEKCSQRFSRA